MHCSYKVKQTQQPVQYINVCAKEVSFYTDRNHQDGKEEAAGPLSSSHLFVLTSLGLRVPLSKHGKINKDTIEIIQITPVVTVMNYSFYVCLNIWTCICTQANTHSCLFKDSSKSFCYFFSDKIINWLQLFCSHRRSIIQNH